MLLRRWAVPTLILAAAAFAQDPVTDAAAKAAAEATKAGKAAAEAAKTAPPPPENDTPKPRLTVPAPGEASAPQLDAPVPPAEQPKIEYPRTPVLDAVDESQPQKPTAADFFGKDLRVEVITLEQTVRLALKNNLDAKIEEAGIALENARLKNAYGEFDPVFSFSTQRQRVKTPDALDNIRNADSLVRLQDAAIATNVVNSGIASFNNTQQNLALFLAQIDERIQAVATQGLLNVQVPSFNFQAQPAALLPQPEFSADILTFIQEVDQAEAGIRLRSPIGTIVGITARGNKTYLSFEGDTRDVLPTYGSSATIEFRQPLLKDAGLDANLADIRISRKNRDAQELTWKFRTEVALQRVAANYYDMVQAYADLGNKSEAVIAGLKLLSFSKRRQDVGFFSPYEVGQAKVQLLSDRSSLYTAKAIVLARQTQLRRDTTSRYDGKNPVVFVPADIPALKVPKLNKEQLLRTAFSRRTDYKALLLAAETEDVRLKFAKNQSWPQLDVVGSYGWTGLDRTFGDSFDRMQNGDAPSWQLGITGSMPFAGLQPRAQIEAAHARKMQAILRIKQAEVSIGFQVDDAIAGIAHLREAILAAKAATAAAAETVAIGFRRMEFGQLSSFELIDQQRRLYETRSRELATQAALNRAITELWLATGTVLENLNVIYEDSVDERKLWQRITEPPPLAKPHLRSEAHQSSTEPRTPTAPAPEPAPAKKTKATEPKQPAAEPAERSLFGPRKRPWEK